MRKLLHNTPTSNPNKLFGAGLALALVLGASACKPHDNTPPTPAETTAGAEQPHPWCAVAATVTGKTVAVKLNTRDTDEPGIYGVEYVQYDFGDGAIQEVQGAGSSTHTYQRSGTSIITAVMHMEVAGTDAERFSQVHDGQSVACDYAVVQTQ